MSEENKATSKKIVVSNILHEKREWVDASKKMPDPNTPVVIRMYNPNILFAETETEIYPAEDVKIAKFLPGLDDPTKGSWCICPPYPRFDYSPLSSKDRLDEGTVVTHWALPMDGEVEGWNTRFDQINLFKKLKLEVDDEHLELVYRALLWGSTYIQKCCGNDPDAVRLATILYDLQYVLDKNNGIDLTDEEYEKLVEERAAKYRAEHPEDGDNEAEPESNEVPGENEPEDKGE